MKSKFTKPTLNRIRSHYITDQVFVDLDGVIYEVKHERRIDGTGEHWYVEAGIRGGPFGDNEVNQWRSCNEDGRTFKRVVAWVKKQLDK